MDNKKHTKRYRVSYDKHFLPQSLNGIPHKGKFIVGLSLYFHYKYYDENGKEMLFSDDGHNLPPCLYTCSYDSKTGYKMVLNSSQLKECAYSNVEYKASSRACIWDCDSNIPIVISLQEAIQILIANEAEFNNNDNRSAQNLSYSLTEVTK